MAPPRKGRPPTLALQTNHPRLPAKTDTVIELETPVDIHPDVDDDDDELLQLSSPSTSGSSSPVSHPSNLSTDSDLNSDELSKDLAVLERLRRSVHKNLRLRPIRSARPIRSQQPLTPSQHSWDDEPQRRSPSPSSSVSPDSAYFTPTSEPRATPLSALYSDAPQWRFEPSRKQSHGRGVDPAVLVARLSSPTRPLLIDTRPLGSFLTARLERSINMAIPSLILKRCRKPNGAFQELDTLRQFITTDDGKDIWDDTVTSADWDGDVILYDELMDDKDRHNSQATAWALLPVVEPLLDHGTVDYLEGGFAGAQRHPYLRLSILTDDSIDEPSPDIIASAPSLGKKSSGLFQLDINSAARSKNLPQVEQMSSSPQALMPTSIHTWHNVHDFATPSPPPSQTVFSRPPPPRRPSVPALRRIDTSSAERLKAPSLHVRTTRSNSELLPVPSADGSYSRSRSRSPSHLSLTHSNHSSPPRSARLLSPNVSTFSDRLPPSPSPSQHSMPHTPTTPIPRSPMTARPEDQPPTTEDPFPVFSVSTILPNFLYLGPELTAEEHVEELKSLGVKRILNLAIECDDDHGLRLRERFERYVRIPMRDTVEEDNITRGVREVCEVLDDARLHSSATYVHCKAGKSRSVTAVMAYLIHANHWTLSRAYSFVVERRRGISPNIGFVSELMTFEEQELGCKSVGVVKMAGGEGGTGEVEGHAPGAPSTDYKVALGGRRPQHIRESLPPAFTHMHSFSAVEGPSPGDVLALGDSGQEMEIKDSSGRYRHARRAPVDEATLQPSRRVSKAGLESLAYV
ncbi:hypothetical protein CERSUDRAFT_97010 [Gelatoporia subvermispora B]|uniref:protein-tyrosine-phosphatase n=1 Tax=Ceriporiopsis subvermispora (strain B) TaxID=914234 RepID=M2R8Q4_CERS8|nr:hypothetical protein CERSUDRAFT_97010 [Gelatoporia subvermispora B]